jgi:hypothetical protein
MVKMIENLGDSILKTFFQNCRKESMILANLEEDHYFCASMHFYKFYMNINCPKPPIIIENCEILSNKGNCCIWGPNNLYTKILVFAQSAERRCPNCKNVFMEPQTDLDL